MLVRRQFPRRRRPCNPAAERLESRVLFSGSWTALTHGAPDGVGTMDLLPNGSVIAAGAGENDWLQLTPDIHGSYVNGTWTTLAPAQDTRLYDATQVLPSGDVFVAGGEYGSGASTGAIYSPITNSWTELPVNNFGEFDDSESVLLNDGTVLIEPVEPSQSGYTTIYNPAPAAAASPWSQGPKLYRGPNADEQSWVKLADGSVITSDGNFTSERYIPANYPGAGAAANTWINDGAVPVALWDGLDEIGPALQMADGRVIFLGATGATAIYTPSGSLAPGTWTAGASLPSGYGADDAPAAMLPNGNILFAVGPAGTYNGPTSFFIYTPAPAPGLGSFTQISGPVPVADAPFISRMLELPDGTVLYTDGGSTLYEYNAGVAPLASSVPIIKSLGFNPDGSIVLSGLGLNGTSAGAAYGDDAQMDSNYPIIRLTSAGGNSVYYATSSDWSTYGTFTTNVAETTDFTLPLGIPAGTYSVNVVANGIQSAPASLTVSFGISNVAPTIAMPAAANSSPVTGITTNLSVLGADVGGESSLTYRWTTASAPANTPLPSFSINGSNAAHAQSATFYAAGTYHFVVYATDDGGLSTSSSVSVTVNQTESNLQISPTSASVNPGGSTTFSATAFDQFGLPMAQQPTIAWSILSGLGTISPIGVYTAASAGAVAVVQANDGILTATATVSVVSSPWSQADIGDPTLAGSGYDSGGVFNLSASGADIGGITDQFHFVYQELTGNGAITALVSGLVSTNTQAKAGVMIRNSLGANDMMAMMAVTTGNGTNFYYRTAAGAPAQNSPIAAGLAAPYWVRIVRIGNAFTGYRSPDGTHWTNVGSVNISMGSVVYFGMAMCSHVATSLGTATIGNVVVNQPSVALPASASAAPIVGTSTNLSVLAADPAGESNVTYTWFASTGAPGGAVVFSGAVNGSNAAKNITATFNAAGTYSFTVVMNDGLVSTLSALIVTVNQTATSILIPSVSGPIAFGSMQSFSARVLDQFNVPMVSQPAIVWSVTGSGNTIDGNGVLTAGAAAGSYMVTATSGVASGQGSFTIAATVEGRYIFYNDSYFDGYDPTAGPSDDNAIAPDKTALLPGQNASFANYTSYANGINGIMVDIGGLENGAALNAGDFTFEIGNSGNLATWQIAPAPTIVLDRPGAGVNGSDRVELVWANGAIKNEWLQITVAADANTGLSAPDVFYFGNQPGETGNSATDAYVNGADVNIVRAYVASSSGPASITNPYDFNRDGDVDGADVNIVRASVINPNAELQLISTPTSSSASYVSAAPAATPNSAAKTPVFTSPAIAVKPIVKPARGPALKVIAAPLPRRVYFIPAAFDAQPAIKKSVLIATIL